MQESPLVDHRQRAFRYGSSHFTRLDVDGDLVVTVLRMEVRRRWSRQYIAMTTPKNRLMTGISVALWHDMLFGRWVRRLNKCKLADLGMR